MSKLFSEQELTSSIVVATYNGGKFLSDQLDSFMIQSVLPDEIIISDDGSTDNTIDIIREFKKRCSCPVILLLNDGKHGVTGNFENAAKHATGDIVFFCDQDDVWYQNKIEENMRLFEKYKDCIGVISDADCVDEELTSLNATFNDGVWAEFKSLDFDENRCCVLKSSEMLDRVICSNIMGGCCLAIRNEKLKLMYDFCPAIYHDDWICFCMFVLGDVVALNKPLFAYRLHGNNTVGFNSLVSNKKSFSSKIKKLVKRFKLIENYYVSNAQRAIYFNRFAKNYGAISPSLDYQKQINIKRLDAATSTKIEGVKILTTAEKEVGMYKSLDYYLEVMYILSFSKKKRVSRLNKYLVSLINCS